MDPEKGKERKAYVFVLTLSHSRHCFVCFVFSQDVATWIDCHIRAFHFFGGVSLTILLDNLKSGVCKPDIYDPVINRTYFELARHYGFVADPTKIRTPQQKGKVERSILIIKQQLIAGKMYADIKEANKTALKWCREEIAHRVVRPTGRTPWECFIQEEKPALRSLPQEPFERPHWQEGIVHRDQHVVFFGSFYSVPFAYIGKKLWIRGTEKTIKIFLENKLIKTHIRTQQKGQWVTDQQDLPKAANYFLKADRGACLEKARKIGQETYQLIDMLLSSPGLTCLRKAQAILRLAECHTLQRLEAACSRALFYEALEYKNLKRILLQGLDQKVPSINTSQLKLSMEGAYLRPASEFMA